MPVFTNVLAFQNEIQSEGEFKQETKILLCWMYIIERTSFGFDNDVTSWNELSFSHILIVQSFEHDAKVFCLKGIIVHTMLVCVVNILRRVKSVAEMFQIFIVLSEEHEPNINGFN